MNFEPLIFVAVGIVIFFTPPEILLKFDRGTGYGIYKQKLDSTNDEAAPLKAAGSFYKFFGAAFSSLGLFFFVIFNTVARLR